MSPNNTRSPSPPPGGPQQPPRNNRLSTLTEVTEPNSIYETQSLRTNSTTPFSPPVDTGRFAREVVYVSQTPKIINIGPPRSPLAELPERAERVENVSPRRRKWFWPLILALIALFIFMFTASIWSLVQINAIKRTHQQHTAAIPMSKSTASTTSCQELRCGTPYPTSSESTSSVTATPHTTQSVVPVVTEPSEKTARPSTTSSPPAAAWTPVPKTSSESSATTSINTDVNAPIGPPRVTPHTDPEALVTTRTVSESTTVTISSTSSTQTSWKR